MKNTNRNIQLALLQIEQYDGAHFLDKKANASSELLKRVKVTTRLKLTKILSYILGVYGANQVLSIFVAMAQMVVYLMIQKKISQLKRGGMKVIAIAGSYGKTSVKKYTYDLLRTKYRVVATPESFNTVMGIAKCLWWEVGEKTQIFIVEVGAYHIGDISYLLTMVRPDIGILTGMARQHLERFGSFQNIQTAKSEIAVYIQKHGGVLIANKSDENVVVNMEKLGVNAIWYSGSTRHEINMNAGQKVAELLGIDATDRQHVKVREPKSRFEMTKKRYGMTVIDDSFSSNDHGFIDGLRYLGKQRKYTRILVTPGLVELGHESNVIHENLGKQVIGNADYVILVGHNERTSSLERGIDNKVKVQYIEKTLDFMRVVKELKLKKTPLVLIENDVTENY